MNNIPERFMVSATTLTRTGKPRQGIGARTRGVGYIAPFANGDEVEVMSLIETAIFKRVRGGKKYRKQRPVDVTTIEPVSVKVLETEGYEACPNCKSQNISFSRLSDRYGEAPEPFQCEYCPDCGQRLDWGVE